MGHTLALNSDYQPISVLPLSELCWQDAIKAVYLGNARALHEYDNWTVHSPSKSFRVPAVIISTEFIRFRRGLGYSDSLLKLRDGYTCQYCLQRFPEHKLTVDHYVPKSKRGGGGYTNLVAACFPCNQRRGDNQRIQPKTKPYRPSYLEMANKVQQFPINVPHRSWADYLGWRSDLIELVEPTGALGYSRPEKVLEQLLKDN